MGFKFRANAAIALVLVLVAAGVTVASATSSNGKHRNAVVLHLLAKEVAETYVDVGDPDYSQGDSFAFANDLFRENKKVGEDGGVCLVSRVRPNGGSTVYCTGSNALPGGQITVSGLVDYGPTEEFKQDPYSLAITGGTGKYRTARGEVTIQELSTQEFRLTVRVIL